MSLFDSNIAANKLPHENLKSLLEDSIREWWGICMMGIVDDHDPFELDRFSINYTVALRNSERLMSIFEDLHMYFPTVDIRRVLVVKVIPHLTEPLTDPSDERVPLVFPTVECAEFKAVILYSDKPYVFPNKEFFSFVL